jgi:two-component system, NarL family, nitrate/nitrite response regulator NarL
MMKLLVVDDHPVLRGGLCVLLLRFENDVVVLQAGSAEEGLVLAAETSDLDIVILDIAMPGMSGFQAIAEFGRLRPELPVGRLRPLCAKGRPPDVSTNRGEWHRKCGTDGCA